MLPGFRFLLAAIVLSTSILVFGLGAAALLRAAHEEFASTPSRRAAPEPKFAQPIDAAPPVLALLRVEPEPVEQKAADAVPESAAPAEPAEPPAVIPSPAEPDKIAALKLEDSTPPETMKPDLPASDTAAQNTNLPAPADTPAPADETRIAAVEPVLPPSDAAVVPEPAPAPAATEPNSAATKIATLGGPPVAIEAEPRAASVNTDRSIVKKRNQARQGKERRRLANRARSTRQAKAQRAADPFSTITTRSR